MAIQVKHKFVSAKVDTLDNSKVQPSNWNADHDLLMGAGAVLGRAPGAGQAAATEVPMGATGQAILAAANQAAAQAAVGADATQATILAAATKATPVDADSVPLIDSAAGNALKRVTWAQIKATLKAYFDTLYSVVGHTHTFASLTGKPTTIAGYGITDSSRGAPEFLLEDQKPAGTDGGTINSGAWQQRVINTIVRNPSALVSIASDTFTPAADGWVEWEAPAHACDRVQSRLFNATDNVVAAYSQGAALSVSGGGYVILQGGGPVTAGKTYRIEQRCQSTRATNGLGWAANFGGVEVFLRIKFWRN